MTEAPREPRNRPHICIMTSAHPMDDVRVFSRIAGSFLAAGYRVSWVGPEKYFHDARAERDAGLEYHVFASGKGLRGRLGSLINARRAARRLTDVDWVYTPDPDAALCLGGVGKKLGARTIFDLHEAFHGGPLDRLLGGRKLPAVRWMVRNVISFAARRASLVTGVSRSVLEHYVGSGGLIVRNCAPAWFGTESTGARKAEGPLRVMHGKASPTNGTPVVLDALARVANNVDLRVLMFPSMADGTAYTSSLDEWIRARGVEGRLDLRAAVPHSEMPSVLASCHVGMIGYGRSLGAESLPNRLFEYMALGCAVLAPDYSPEIVDIISRERNGRVVDFEDPVAVANALEWFAQNPGETALMGARSRQAFVERHNWDVEFARLLRRMDGA